jgi:Reverse transcriptase (RNA-dependent DNA polymerase).
VIDKIIYEALQHIQIPNKHIILVKAIMDNRVAKVQVKTEMTGLFEIRGGLAPLLFSFVMEYVVREVTVDRNATLRYKLTQIVGYGDDICIIGRMKDAMNQISIELKRAAREMSLSFGVNKTKVVVQSRCDTPFGRK